MRSVKVLLSILFLAILTSNVRLISYWSESRGVYDDICYLRQAHLFQRFGWQGLDTNLAHETDGYLAGKLRSIGYPDWSDATRAPCHTRTADGSKSVMTPPPGTGFVLALFPEGFQVVPLYMLANVMIAGFALYGVWRSRKSASLALAAMFGLLSIYFMINPTKASYSMAPTMVVCALTGLFTARLFAGEGRRLTTIAIIGLLLGLSASFRIANVVLAAGYLLFFGLSFLVQRNRESFVPGLALGLAFLVGLLPVLAANLVNSGNPLVSAYGGPDTAAPHLDPAVLQAYLRDFTQLPVILIACVWTALLWRFANHVGIRQLTLLVAANLALNLAFFATHPVFTQYYVIPVLMLSLWTLLFGSVLTSGPAWALAGHKPDGPRPAEMLSRSPR